jgi:hypothetical protein
LVKVISVAPSLLAFVGESEALAPVIESSYNKPLSSTIRMEETLPAQLSSVQLSLANIKGVLAAPVVNRSLEVTQSESVSTAKAKSTDTTFDPDHLVDIFFAALGRDRKVEEHA